MLSSKISKSATVAFLAASSLAQLQSKLLFVESFRKGSTQIAERTIDVTLNTQNPIFETQLKDASEEGRYQLSLTPSRDDDQLQGIGMWRVTLIDLHRKHLGNLLTPLAPGAAPAARAEEGAWLLDPNPYAAVPLNTTRVFHVEDFYCSASILEKHQITPERVLLDSMKVQVKLTNSRPES